MISNAQPDIVTLVAGPPVGVVGTTGNLFIEAALQKLQAKKASGNRIIQVASVLDIDLELGKIVSDRFRGTIRLQIVGHSLSGILSLGASWMADAEVATAAFKYPYYALDTNPSALGLLAKYAGKISEVMLVGCNIGSASSYGYAINGRTLTYTLAELLRCLVRGADDLVSPDEFDAQGWYEPNLSHRRAKGWRWVDARPPVWVDPGLDPVSGHRARVAKSFEIQSVTRSLLPGLTADHPIELTPPVPISCQYAAPTRSPSAIPELSVETDQGSAQLLCGGRYLRWMDCDYLIDPTPQLAAALTAQLGSAATPVQLTSIAG